jgi:hypothetical protein
MEKTMNQKVIICVLYIFLFSISIYSQQNKSKNQIPNEINKESTIDKTQASDNKIIFKEGLTTLVEIDKQGTGGAIILPSTGSTQVGFRLYNNSGNLYWGTTKLNLSGGASSIDDLSDAQHSDASLYLGFEAGGINDDGGNNNTGVGFQSLFTNTSGDFNVGNGYQSLYTNTSGQKNTANGYQSMFSNIGGNHNVANGYQALYSNTSGNYNTASGSFAQLLNTSGANNTANGYMALLSNTTGYNNASLGYQSLYTNSTGNNNSGLGSGVLYNNSDGKNNTAVGYQALFSNVSGAGNVMLGHKAGYNELTSNKLYIENSSSNNPLIWGDFSTNEVKINGNFHVTGNITRDGIFDHGSLNDLADAVNDTDFVSIYLGTGISEPIPTGSYQNTAVGHDALINIDGGDNNTALGYRALKDNSTGEHNIAVGPSALRRNTSGGKNIAVGYSTLLLTETGSSNIAIGHTCMQTNTGSSNTGIGEASLYTNRSGSYNVAVGDLTLRHCENGNYNTAIGYSAGRVLPDNAIYSIAIGANAAPTGSFQARIGSSSTSSIGGQVGWTTLSDGRFKNNIDEQVPGIEFVMGLRPVTYNFDTQGISEFLQEDYSLDENGNRTKKQPSAALSSARQSQSIKRNTGFIAQEVEELVNKLGYDFSGVEVPENEQSMYRLRYAEFVVPIVKAMQEQQEMIAELRAEIEELKRK